jgi:SEC-C motif-containing protein
MRSRFSAYSFGLVDYIVETTVPGGPNWEIDHPAWRESLTNYCRNNTFRALTIHEAAPPDDPEPDEAEVLFTAELASQQGGDRSFSERSRFVRIGGQWLYHSGKPS